jgi:hypothetical protein
LKFLGVDRAGIQAAQDALKTLIPFDEMRAPRTNGVDQCLPTASAINLSTYAKLAVQMWFKADSLANNDSLATGATQATHPFNPNPAGGGCIIGGGFGCGGAID